MKKILSVFILVVFLFISVQATGIKVILPNGIDKLLMGEGGDITWACLAGVTEKIKIRLFDQTGNKILNIEDSIDNNGKYKWTIPMSLNAGKYFLRIKTVDNQYSGESALFSIDKLQKAPINLNVEKKVILPKPLPLDLKKKDLPDFHIYEMKLSPSNELLILYENLGATYSGILEMKYEIKGNENTVLSNVVILRGKRQIFKTARFLTVNDLSMNGRSVGVKSTVDPNENIDEVADTNNVKFKSLYPEFDIPDYHPTELEYVKIRRSDQPRALPFGYFKVKIKNLGSSYTGKISIQKYYRYPDEDKFLHNVPPQIFEVSIGENQEKWINLNKFWWYPRDRTTTEALDFMIRIRPVEGNLEMNLKNNIIVTGIIHPNDV